MRDVDSRQWVQPLFMVYDSGTDELIPLTQSRLDDLLKVEKEYGRLIVELRNHTAFVDRITIKRAV